MREISNISHFQLENVNIAIETCLFYCFLFEFMTTNNVMRQMKFQMKFDKN